MLLLPLLLLSIGAPPRTATPTIDELFLQLPDDALGLDAAQRKAWLVQKYGGTVILDKENGFLHIDNVSDAPRFVEAAVFVTKERTLLGLSSREDNCKARRDRFYAYDGRSFVDVTKDVLPAMTLTDFGLNDQAPAKLDYEFDLPRQGSALAVRIVGHCAGDGVANELAHRAPVAVARLAFDSRTATFVKPPAKGGNNSKAGRVACPREAERQYIHPHQVLHVPLSDGRALLACRNADMGTPLVFLVDDAALKKAHDPRSSQWAKEWRFVAHDNALEIVEEGHGVAFSDRVSLDAAGQIAVVATCTVTDEQAMEKKQKARAQERGCLPPASPSP